MGGQVIGGMSTERLSRIDAFMDKKYVAEGEDSRRANAWFRVTGKWRTSRVLGRWTPSAENR